MTASPIVWHFLGIPIDVTAVAIWGLVATLLQTVVETTARGLGISRMSIPLMLGSMFTRDRDRAAALGVLAHAANGWVLAFVYAVVFQAVGYAGWGLGALLGAVHGALVLVVLMPILPAIHPRMASEHQGPEPTRGLEPPGFFALNYGRMTPTMTLVAHTLYGITLGGFYHLV